ncbi:hypothetical protein DRQ50_08705 [bacterium]|nr:MAG: hypothetical protein DRQ50_08705 [bacterium]
MRTRLTWVVLLLCVLIVPRGVWSAGAIDATRATRLKAAFIFQMAHLTEWPHVAFDAGDDSLYIGIVGDDPHDMVGYFRDAQDLDVNGHPLQVRHYADPDQVPTTGPMHILFITSDTGPGATRPGPPNVLIAGETSHFCRDGGMVGFVADGGRIRIEVNPRTLREAGLRLSAEFLQHATIIADDVTRRGE